MNSHKIQSGDLSDTKIYLECYNYVYIWAYTRYINVYCMSVKLKDIVVDYCPTIVYSNGYTGKPCLHSISLNEDIHPVRLIVN